METRELRHTLQDFSRQSIFGHSMGGHGALTIYLNSIRKGTKQFRSCSAFAPIANPTNCPWGQKAFSGYLQGGVEEAKEQYDATELVSKLGGKPVHILVDYVRNPYTFHRSSLSNEGNLGHRGQLLSAGPVAT